MTTFTADQVWACAAAADRINEGYLKEDLWMHNATPPYLHKRANKSLVKEWLRDQNYVEVTEADYAAGRAVRDSFKGYTLKAITGQLNEFQQQILKIVSKDTFTGRDMYDFAVVACLPDVSRRDQAKTDLKREIFASEQLKGEIGDTIVSDAEIITCRFNKEFCKYRITARLGDSFVDFWYKEAMTGSVRIKGKIKFVRGDKTTALNYVKKA